MTLKTVCAAALCVLALAGCDNSKNPYREVKLDKTSSPADSLGYMLGEMANIQRLAQAQQDSLKFSGAKAVQSYDDGFLAGLAAIKEGDEAYNAGLQAGMMWAAQRAQLAEQTGLKIDKGAIYSGFAAGLGDKKLDEQKAQKIQQQAMNTLSNAMAKKSAAVKEEFTKGKGYKQQGGLYLKENKAGSGPKLQKGQSVNVKLNLLDKNRKEVMPGAGDQATPMQVGQGFLPILDQLFPLISDGASVEVAATGSEIFPQGAGAPGIEPGEIYILTVELVPGAPAAVPGQGAAPAPQAAPAAPAAPSK